MTSLGKSRQHMTKTKVRQDTDADERQRQTIWPVRLSAPGLLEARLRQKQDKN